ncbi:MAG: hypothetical protein BA861_00195 [Desulfobacterales bacterium S3730MH5]|nr:MAG: hypothetical protein BA861_00195 [Desulfobacterales bacterium S3730MH5]
MEYFKKTMSKHEKEVDQGNRFEFGKNWRRFLNSLDEEHIAEAERRLLRTHIAETCNHGKAG